MNQLAIRCKGIKKSYGTGDNKVEALKGIDLDIHQGELTLLVGPSGSGKSSLISIIATILTPDEGQLLMLEHDIGKLSENEKALFRNRHLGVVFQSFFLIPTLTVVENITLPLLVRGSDQKAATKKAKELLALMNLSHKANFSPASLSKGQQQRVAIARAIINDSKIIACDEPTSALDHVAGGEIMTLLHELALNSSRAVLVVTHDQRLFSYADRIIKMDDGLIDTGVQHA